MPIKLSDYPADWKIRSRFVRLYRARNRCEWCGAENGKPHPTTGSRVVLTTAHVFDKRPDRASLLNLAALCQRCHLQHDAPDRAAAKARKAKHRAIAAQPAARSCVQLIRAKVPQLPVPQKALARAMGLSPSDLSRKLAQHPDDSRRFTLDDLERYVAVTGDTQPVLYLVEKYLAGGGDELAQLERRIAELKGQRAAIRAAS